MGEKGSVDPVDSPNVSSFFSHTHYLSCYSFYATLSFVEQMVKFKWHYCTAITKHKTDLEAMYKAVWAIFKHKVKCHYYLNKYRLTSHTTLSVGIYKWRSTPRVVSCEILRLHQSNSYRQVDVCCFIYYSSSCSRHWIWPLSPRHFSSRHEGSSACFWRTWSQ